MNVAKQHATPATYMAESEKKSLEAGPRHFVRQKGPAHICPARSESGSGGDAVCS